MAHLIAAALLLALPRLADAGADAGDVVQRVQATVLRLKTQLPDFLCRETITSQIRTLRRVLQQTVIVSRFAGRQIQSAKTDLSFDESRVVHSVNGKPALFLFTGGFSSTLGSTFGPRGKVYHSFRLDARARPWTVIKFKTKGTRLPTLSNGSFDFAYRDYGTAWINPTTIAGDTYPLPATVLVREKLPATSLPLFGVFRAEYRDHRKFTATSEFEAVP